MLVIPRSVFEMISTDYRDVDLSPFNVQRNGDIHISEEDWRVTEAILRGLGARHLTATPVKVKPPRAAMGYERELYVGVMARLRQAANLWEKNKTCNTVLLNTRWKFNVELDGGTFSFSLLELNSLTRKQQASMSPLVRNFCKTCLSVNNPNLKQLWIRLKQKK